MYVHTYVHIHICIYSVHTSSNSYDVHSTTPVYIRMYVRRLKGIHQKEIEELQQHFKAELQAKEEELVKERDAALAETRRTLAAEQINEEKQLKTEKEKALEETRRRLQEEEDNEEAELHESKTNRIIKTKQQVRTYILGSVGGICMYLYMYVCMYVRMWVAYTYSSYWGYEVRHTPSLFVGPSLA